MTVFEGCPTVERSVSVGGRTWRLHAVFDHDALLAFAGQRQPFPFGALLWESAVALGDCVAMAGASLRGRRVLELGCGVGLAGIVAAAWGGEVTATDHDGLVLEIARANAIANGVGGISHVRADWTAWNDASAYDLIIGADVIYDHAAHAAVLAILQSNLADGGTALLADPGRHSQAAFVAHARSVGFHVTIEARPVADLIRAGQMVEITMMTVTRIMR